VPGIAAAKSLGAACWSKLTAAGLPAAAPAHCLQCQDVPTLTRLLQAGVACARIDLSWGTKQYHARSLANLQEAMQQTRRLCR
jgi:pyruvate kinase